MVQTDLLWGSVPGPSNENYSGQLMLYLVGAHVKTLQTLRHSGELPTPVLELYMHNKVWL